MNTQGSLLPPILNPSSLYSQEAKRDATRIRIYNMVLQTIYNKVKSVARVPGNEKSLWYVVPEFIPGTPRFDVKDCIVYLVWNLRNAGYQVEYTHPNLMAISWKNHDDKYKERESPWAQVLGAARDQVFQGVGNTTVAPSRATAPRTTARSAASVATAMISGGGGYSSGGYGSGSNTTGGWPHSSLIPDHITAPESEHKRKTILKKTAEYRPGSATIAAPPPQKDSALTGTLSSRHISFV